MKKIVLTVLAMLFVAGSAFAGGGTKLMYDTQVLISAATSTVTGDAKDLNAAYKDFSVDVVTLATGTVVVRIDGNASGDSVFDTTGLGDAITCGSLKCTVVYNSQPMVQVRGVITSATGTNSTTVTITGVQ